MSSAHIRHTGLPIGSHRFVLFRNAGSIPFARHFNLWGHFVPTDDSQLAGIELGDAIRKVRI